MTELSKQADLACRGALHSGPQHDGHPRRWLILPVLLGGTFLLLVDFSVVNVALPLIRADLRADAGELQLIIAFYAVTYAVFLITGGRLGDLFGRKAMFMAGMAGFTAASAACGFAPSIHVLIAGRLLQGVAAAMLSPQVLATIRVIFPADERNRAIACYAATIGLGLVLGNVCGGLLIGLHPLGYTWRAVFLINLPVGAFDLAAAAWLLPPSPRSGNVRLDLTGVAMLSIGLLLLIDPLVAGREAGWPAWTLVCLALSVPAMALFIAFEQRVGRRGGDPLIDMRLFHDRGFSVGLALCLMVYASAGYFFCYAVYLQSGLGWSVVAAGLGMLPYAFGFLAGSLAVPSLIQRFGLGALISGYIVGIIGQGAVVALLLRGGQPGGAMFAALAIAGLGLGIVLPALIQIVLRNIPFEHAGMASGVLNTAIQVGPAIAVPVIGGVFFTVLGNASGPQAYTQAFAAALACVIATLVVSLGLTVLLRQVR
jgi:EmrB/QacA subfamily drug resistance transporter